MKKKKSWSIENLLTINKFHICVYCTVALLTALAKLGNIKKLPVIHKNKENRLHKLLLEQTYYTLKKKL